MTTYRVPLFVRNQAEQINIEDFKQSVGEDAWAVLEDVVDRDESIVYASPKTAKAVRDTNCPEQFKEELFMLAEKVIVETERRPSQKRPLRVAIGADPVLLEALKKAPSSREIELERKLQALEAQLKRERKEAKEKADIAEKQMLHQKKEKEEALRKLKETERYAHELETELQARDEKSNVSEEVLLYKEKAESLSKDLQEATEYFDMFQLTHVEPLEEEVKLLKEKNRQYLEEKKALKEKNRKYLEEKKALKEEVKLLKEKNRKHLEEKKALKAEEQQEAVKREKSSANLPQDNTVEGIHGSSTNQPKEEALMSQKQQLTKEEVRSVFQEVVQENNKLLQELVSILADAKDESVKAAVIKAADEVLASHAERHEETMKQAVQKFLDEQQKQSIWWKTAKYTVFGIAVAAGTLVILDMAFRLFKGRPLFLKGDVVAE